VAAALPVPRVAEWVWVGGGRAADKPGHSVEVSAADKSLPGARPLASLPRRAGLYGPTTASRLRRR